MTEFRRIRLEIGLTQVEFARQLGAAANSVRMWDSGLRPVPPAILVRARDMVAERLRHSELLSLSQLAAELGMHRSTLEAAARTGRLRVHFLTQSVFGRPIRKATRVDGYRFRDKFYRLRCTSPQTEPVLPSVPTNCDHKLVDLRKRLRLTQDALAVRIGAAGKAVIYQSESRKRVPSPVFWRQVEALSDQ